MSDHDQADSELDDLDDDAPIACWCGAVGTYDELFDDAFLDEGKTGPLPIAAYSVLLMHVTQGRCYSVAEMSAWLRDAGFGAASIVPSAVGRSALVARRSL
mgnify:CR=1 FL=1